MSKIAVVAAQTPEAQAALADLQRRYGTCSPDAAEVIVALGGDGFMLRTLHRYLRHELPVYGMKLGTIGFLMNQYRPEDLPERIARAQPAPLRPLQMEAQNEAGGTISALAFNEVSLLRQTKQAAHVRVDLNGATKVPELICDGVIVATAAGSTAYNLSAHGPILPFGSNMLALTPISPFRPRRWRGAILPATVDVRFEILDPYKRPVSATADSNEVRDVIDVRIRESSEQTMTLLFDPEHNLEERILDEQFTF
ncbi:NAD kinase [Dokdonella koreensis]|uniref:NAD kinase n=1 Tax=Dokdonella koreensis DS-123 TaxID=1300342 RepID=A0A160DX86_9GAMM|nr:NAD kinase [Dokdonella koreensis]ANB19307.1 Inorganic polyphosphate/ATP-NAD kinase [Dokdonella koreensis DS-123]